jgi:rhodanese-related sulfurtransferase
MAARLAETMGYTNIKVFHAGTPVWQKEGYPLLTTYGFVSKRLENVVLIDTRGPEAAKKGHIEGAFTIPLDQLAQEKDQFPLDTKVPIILYGQNTELSEISPVMEELALWIDHKLFVLDGGYKGWVEKGGPVQSEKIRTKIVYLPKPGPGEIVGDEFMNIVNSEPENKIILDVRSAEEAAEGKIGWALTIPLDDLQSRLSDLPKDKEIIIHCGSGMRAQMAFNVLQNAGYQSRFLADKVAFIEEKPICCFKE